MVVTRLKEYIVDRYLTWKTGNDKATREWQAWLADNVNYQAHSVNDMFKHFKHIVEVDWRKFITDDGLAWVPVPEAKKYFWPERKMGHNAIWTIKRVSVGQWGEWNINDCFGEDRIFVATNSDEDALMIALLYS